jgi:hypothetical protein
MHAILTVYSFIPSLLHVLMSIYHLQGALLPSLLTYTKTVHAVLVVLVKKLLRCDVADMMAGLS